MIKIFAAFVVSFSLTGCFYQTVNNVDLEKAISACGNSQNIELIESHTLGQEIVKCKNGQRVYLDSYKL